MVATFTPPDQLTNWKDAHSPPRCHLPQIKCEIIIKDRKNDRKKNHLFMFNTIKFIVVTFFTYLFVSVYGFVNTQKFM